MRQHHPLNFPVPFEVMAADIRFQKLTPGKKKRIGPFTIELLQLVHPGDSFAYRIEHDGRAFVYASDASYNDLSPQTMQQFYDFYQDAEALVFDAYFALIESFEKSDWGHSSSFIGVDIALHADVKRLLLFHHAPQSDDRRLHHLLQSTRNYLNHVAPDSPCEVTVAYEGLELEI